MDGLSTSDNTHNRTVMPPQSSVPSMQRQRSVRGGKHSKSRSSRNVTALEVASSATSYADAKYVKRSSDRSTASTKSNSSKSSHSADDENMQKAALLDVPSHHVHPQDPLNSSSSYRMEEDELLQDDFLDEMNDKAHNFDQFGDTANKSHRRRNYAILAKRYAQQNKRTVLGATLVCVGFIVVIGAIVGYLGDQGGSSSSSSTNNALIQQVPPAPGTLKMVCDKGTSSILSSSCQQSCNKAECCWNPNGNFVCSSETQANCPAYIEPCAVMMEQEMETEEKEQEQVVTTKAPELTEMTVAAPPFTLRNECRAESGATDVCQEQCAQAECCWSHDSPYTCTSDTVHNCGIYKSLCSFYNTDTYEQVRETPSPLPQTLQGDLPFPPAPIGISFFCDPGHMGEDNLDVCQIKCNDADCCWKTGVESCVNSVPNNACAAYTEACAFWNDRGAENNNAATTTAEAAPESVPETTAPETSSTLEVAPESVPETTAPETSSTPEVAPESVPETTTTSSNSNTGDSHSTTSMAGHSDTEIFEEDQATTPAAAQASAPEIPAAPADLQSRCSFLSLSTFSGKQDCQDQCAQAECCWVPQGNADGIVSCQADHKDTCDAWMTCGVLIGVGDGHGVSGITPPTAATASNNSENASVNTESTSGSSSAVAKACDVSSTSFQRSQCISVCQAGTCCFDATEVCHESIDCTEYSPCSVLNRRHLRHGA